MDYRIDLQDLKFQLMEWLPTADLFDSELFGDWDRASVGLVLDEGLKISHEKLSPANQEGDREGAVWTAGAVTVPKGYHEAYRTLVDGGWVGSTCNPEFGGLGLPHVVGTALTEFFCGSNLSLSLVLLLTRGASALIENHGTDEMRELFCEKLYTGQWAGTMCLTESQAGSDVGASRAVAEKQGNGRYLISGEKIFITYGEHDLTENIVHTVLARVPGAPSGSRGLSLFVIPKSRVLPDGSLGEANDVTCTSIEHKLGIHGSPTCTLVFGENEQCEGFLLGEENQGMKLMFEMMNAARIEVGLQAMAVAGAAQQEALHYAKERIQSRHWTKMAERDAPPALIVEHPDVRRMLLLSSAYVQAMRALLLKTSLYIDLAEVSDSEESHRYQESVDLLTPICKAWASDWGFRVTEWSLQVYGGYGYTKDYPAEQYLRDCKIASIYEGTNGIQALDLVARKISAKGGSALRRHLGEVAATVESLGQTERLKDCANLLNEALDEVEAVLLDVFDGPEAIEMKMLNAVPFLEMMGSLLAGNCLLEQGMIAAERLRIIIDSEVDKAASGEPKDELPTDNREAAFLHDKIQAARHFAYRVLPQVRATAVAIRAGEKGPTEALL
jgi:alkylation response protein AidB-like acyl-CoA dehydrogenase